MDYSDLRCIFVGHIIWDHGVCGDGLGSRSEHRHFIFEFQDNKLFCHRLLCCRVAGARVFVVVVVFMCLAKFLGFNSFEIILCMRDFDATLRIIFRDV